MTKSRASKGLLIPPKVDPIPNGEYRQKWLENAEKNFVQPGSANRRIYSILLRSFWPEGHGIPGPHLTEAEVRAAVQAALGKAYSDVFRRLRELQGEEGFTCIIKEGKTYQLRDLTVTAKREPRAKPSDELWNKLVEAAAHRCSHCGQQEPDIKLSPDHRIPRSRNGTNDDWNWQPLCEQCNNIKSSACQGCTLRCETCHWAYPETYKQIVISDDNREKIRRVAETLGVSQEDFANKVLADHFRYTPTPKRAAK